jgi:hypothetical protein
MTRMAMLRYCHHAKAIDEGCTRIHKHTHILLTLIDMIHAQHMHARARVHPRTALFAL